MQKIIFSNIEKVAAYLITADGSDFSTKSKHLVEKGYSEDEINIGTNFAISAILLIIFRKSVADLNKEAEVIN